MARHVGRDGSVSISGQSIGYVTAWSYEESADELESTAMGDGSRQYFGGYTDGSGTIDFRFDGENAGQSTALDLLKTGEQVEVILNTGEKALTGSTAVVTSYSLNTSYDDVVGGTFGYRGVLVYSGA